MFRAFLARVGTFFVLLLAAAVSAVVWPGLCAIDED